MTLLLFLFVVSETTVGQRQLIFSVLHRNIQSCCSKGILLIDPFFSTTPTGAN
jgi:hypothetical protein